MKKKLIILIFYIPVLLFISCRECPKEKFEGDYTFSETELHNVPYNGNVILTFKNSTGDTICLNGGIPSLTMSQHHYFPDGETECPTKYWNNEEIRIYFYGSNDSYLSIYLGKNRDARNVLQIGMRINAPYNFGLGVYSMFSSNIFYCVQGDIVTPLDSLIINNKKFYSVYEFSRDCGMPTSPSFYYTINDGIVGFKTTSNGTWNLE